MSNHDHIPPLSLSNENDDSIISDADGTVAHYQASHYDSHSPSVIAVSCAPLVSPRVAVSSTIDTPRPTKTKIRRRMSASSGTVRRSPLRYAQSESSFAQFMKPLQELQEKNSKMKLATTSGLTKSPVRCSSSESGGETSCKINAQVSPVLARNSENPQPLYLLEQVFLRPGGGIETRQVLGVYTSKKKAERAAKQVFEDYNEQTSSSSDGSEEALTATMKLVTSQVGVDEEPKPFNAEKSLQ